MARDTPMKLLAFLMQTGGHIAGWRHPRAASDALTDIDYFTALGRVAERGLFDAVFLADYVGYHPVKGASVFAGMETPKLDPLRSETPEWQVCSAAGMPSVVARQGNTFRAARPALLQTRP